MNRVFGLPSLSIYKGETAVFDKFSETSSLIGHDEERSGEQIQHDEDGILLIKTHGASNDDAACMYIVRDGRTAIVSYFHYIRNFDNADVSMEDIIEGKAWAGSWSEHFSAWDPENRKNTLLLKYENLRDHTMETCEIIGEFIGKKPLRRFDITFAELQRRNPEFFRLSNDNISLSEIEPFSDVFLKHHGALMQKLGYL